MDALDKNGSWKEQKVKLKKRFEILQDSDLLLEEGKNIEMLAKLEIKLGITRDELLHIIAGL